MPEVTSRYLDVVLTTLDDLRRCRRAADLTALVYGAVVVASWALLGL